MFRKKILHRRIYIISEKRHIGNRLPGKHAVQPGSDKKVILKDNDCMLKSIYV